MSVKVCNVNVAIQTMQCTHKSRHRHSTFAVRPPCHCAIPHSVLISFILLFHSTIRSFTQTMSSDEDSQEWKPQEQKPKGSKNPTRAPATGEKKAAAKRPAKPKEPKPPKEPKAPRVPKEPKPRAPRKPISEGKPRGRKVSKDPGASRLGGPKGKKTDDEAEEGKAESQVRCQEEGEPSVRMKEEVRLFGFSVRMHLHTKYRHQY